MMVKCQNGLGMMEWPTSGRSLLFKAVELVPSSKNDDATESEKLQDGTLEYWTYLLLQLATVSHFIVEIECYSYLLL